MNSYAKFCGAARRHFYAICEKPMGGAHMCPPPITHQIVPPLSMPISFPLDKLHHPSAIVGTGEDILHYFLRCPRQTKTREDLFQTLTLLLNKRFVDFSVTNQIDILLNGPQMKNNVKIASKVAFAVQNFILKSGRFYLT